MEKLNPILLFREKYSSQTHVTRNEYSLNAGLDVTILNGENLLEFAAILSSRITESREAVDTSEHA